VLDRLEEIELTNDCGKCAFDTCFKNYFGKPGTPSSCDNGPGGNNCIKRRRRNIRALTESESNYSKNEGNSSGVAQIDFLHESETSSRGLQSDFSDRWEEMILDIEKCKNVVYMNRENNKDGGVTRPVTTIEFSEQYLNSMSGGNICGDSTVAKRETVILIACKELLETDNNDFTYFIDKTVEEDDVYVTTSIRSSSDVTPQTKMNTVCDGLYELVTSGDCMDPEVVNNADECKDAFNYTFGVDNVDVEEWNSPSYAKGCFKHNYGNVGSPEAAQSTTHWVYNQNGGPGTSGHCTGEPSYAACVCRTPEWIMTYGVGSFENMKQNSRLWKAGSKFIKQNVPYTSSMCGIESCTETVLNRIACKDGKVCDKTCGTRINKLMDKKSYSEAKACTQVAKQKFPSICGLCNPHDPTFYIRRRCEDCAPSHQDIIYKRLTSVPSDMDVEDLFLANWSIKNNIMGVDFKLYSNLKHAMWNTKEWQFCNYDQWGGKSVAYYVWHKNHLIH